jgi:hypothetical protein
MESNDAVKPARFPVGSGVRRNGLSGSISRGEQFGAPVRNIHDWDQAVQGDPDLEWVERLFL